MYKLMYLHNVDIQELSTFNTRIAVLDRSAVSAVFLFLGIHNDLGSKFVNHGRNSVMFRTYALT